MPLDDMPRKLRILCTSLCLLGPILSHCTARAQPSAIAPAGDDYGNAQPAPPLEEESPLLVEPNTPEQKLRAAVLLSRLGRPNLARNYLGQLIGPNADDAVLLQLRDQFGPAVFLNLSNNKELRPESTQLLELITDATRRRGADPAYVDRLIADLGAGAAQREIAIIALGDAGPQVVPRMLEALGDAERAGQHNDIRLALIRMGPQIIPAMIAATDEAAPLAIQGAAIEILGRIGDRSLVEYLWYPAFGENQPEGIRLVARRSLARLTDTPESQIRELKPFAASRELERHARRHFELRHSWTIGSDGRVIVWGWNRERQTVEMLMVSPERASLFTGRRFARQAMMMAPEQTDLQALFLALALAEEASRFGPTAPLPAGPGSVYNAALISGADVAENALRQAMDAGNIPAAVAMLQVLSEVSTKHSLFKAFSEPSPILVALNYPDSRVQFAAARAILELDPDQPFRGAARVVEVLTRSLQSDGGAKALVVHASTQRAVATAGLLGQMRFEPLTARTGQAAFQIASSRGDVELVVLDVNTIRWGLSQTIANFRADARTAALPIAVMGPPDLKSRVERLLFNTPRTIYITESTTVENLQNQLEPFLNQTLTPAMSAEERSAQASAAAYWLAYIAQSKRTDIFDLTDAETALLNALADEDLAENALIALSVFPSVAVQRELQVIAISSKFAPELRHTAAVQLAFHIQRFGLLLTADQINETLALWRVETDPDLSTALAAVIGTLKPNARRVTERLEQLPEPTNPAP